MLRLLSLIATVAILLIACRRDNPSPANPTPSNPTPQNPPANPQNPPSTNPVISPSIYIAGDSFDLSTRYVPFPVYWKNGKQVHLPHPGYSSGTGIVVSDSNVYVSSSGVFAGNNVTFWHNGKGVNLADPTITYPTAMAITLSGKDVYTAGSAYINGFEKLVPIYWKNEDKAIKIETYSYSRGEARGIAVSGNDVYVTGSTADIASGPGSSPPCYWKNGTPTFLHALSPSSLRGIAKSIFVSGNDVHVVGEVYPIGSGSPIGWAVYWKNGVPTELTPSTQISEANCVTVIGDDVYIAGGVAGADRLLRATYWKNGVPVTLDAKYSVANSIAVYENDIYVAGNRGVDTALYWKNSSPVILGRGRANAIVVRK